MKEWLLPFVCALATGTLLALGRGRRHPAAGVHDAVSWEWSTARRKPSTCSFSCLRRPSACCSTEKMDFWRGKPGGRAAIPGTLASLAGAVAATAVDVSLLRRPFGIFLLYSGAAMLLSAKKQKK